MNKNSCTNAQRAEEIHLANAQGPGTEKWHIFSSTFISKDTQHRQRPRGGGKLSVKSPGPGNFIFKFPKCRGWMVKAGIERDISVIRVID